MCLETKTLSIIIQFMVNVFERWPWRLRNINERAHIWMSSRAWARSAEALDRQFACIFIDGCLLLVVFESVQRSAEGALVVAELNDHNRLPFFYVARCTTWYNWKGYASCHWRKKTMENVLDCEGLWPHGGTMKPSPQGLPKIIENKCCKIARK